MHYIRERSYFPIYTLNKYARMDATLLARKNTMDREYLTACKQVRLWIFIAIILMDWLYVIIVQRQPNIGINAWFVLFPFISLLYFAASLLAVLGLVVKSSFGTAFACCTILFGAISASISYNLAFQHQHPLIESVFVYLLIINGISVLYIGLYQKKA